MLILPVAALLGVLSGIFIRQKLLAIPSALTFGLLLHAVVLLLMMGAAPGGRLYGWLAFIAGPSLLDLIPTAVAGGSGAIVAAVLWSSYAKQSTNRFWMPTDDVARPRGKDGRLKRLELEDRPIHAPTKVWMDELLNR